MPYGVSGIIKGAAVCFYGFIGFDCIATAGEEAKNPKKSIPFAVIVLYTLLFYYCTFIESHRLSIKSCHKKVIKLY